MRTLSEISAVRQTLGAPSVVGSNRYQILYLSRNLQTDLDRFFSASRCWDSGRTALNRGGVNHRGDPKG